MARAPTAPAVTVTPFTVTVFCGSRAGNHPDHAAGAAALGRGLAAAGMRLVFGGGKIGLMGAVADAALAEGGAVIGVIPDFLTRLEVAHDGVGELVVTTSMHARKQLMFDLADAFVVLPGGLGTLDETVEILTWRQLGLHAKPVLLCDIQGSAAPLRVMIESAVAAGFAPEAALTFFEPLAGVAPTLARLRALAQAGRAAGR
jgi:uncharacterized protein (TIGR00730 family)